MGIIIQIKEALANLLSSKLRSFLAILGILVGTGSVVALITSSQLASAHALAQFKKLGTNILAMSVESHGEESKNARQLTLSDMPKLKNASKQIVEVAPYMMLYSNIYFHGKPVQEASAVGATKGLSDVVKIEVSSGRFVSYLDKSSLFCVIGKDVAALMQKSGISQPIGQQIQVGKRFLTVIGVMKTWEPNMFLYANLNKGIIVPLETAYLLNQYAKINSILFRLIKNPDLELAKKKLKAKLASLFPEKSVHFRDPKQLIDVMAKQQATFTWLLGSIGGISLLVGGIGVMNIMLVSVIERRQEIGIRMAIGARTTDIRNMFLIESVILTLLGGILGILIGVGAAFVLTIVTGWAFHFYLLPPFLGFAVSVLVGVVSGFYPAHRASQLDPIETLQGE